MPDAFITTERLILRRFELSDAVRLSEYRSHPDVARLQAWDTYPLERAEETVQAMQLRQALGTDWFMLAVTDKNTGVLMGDACLRCHELRLKEGLSGAEIGYNLAHEFWGQGFATEAVGALLRFCFEDLNLHRLTAYTDVRNASSRRLLERLGFRLEGISKESWFEHGAWWDDCQYAILRREYAKNL